MCHTLPSEPVSVFYVNFSKIDLLKLYISVRPNGLSSKPVTYVYNSALLWCPVVLQLVINFGGSSGIRPSNMEDDLP